MTNALRKALPTDYEENPARFRLARAVAAHHALAPDVHRDVARRARATGQLPLLDIGCGEGELARHLPDGAWVGVDNSAAMLRRAPEGAVLAEAEELPFADESFGSAALLYVLYHLADPARALAEARRVLRPGGLIAVAAPSRHDSPELGDALPHAPLTFDAELAPALMCELFESIEVRRWDSPLLVLPQRDDVRDYLIGKGGDPAAAAHAGAGASVPLSVTKRGALVLARKSTS
jgi:SAM-dependent methyltransferase